MGKERGFVVEQRCSNDAHYQSRLEEPHDEWHEWLLTPRKSDGDGKSDKAQNVNAAFQRFFFHFFNWLRKEHEPFFFSDESPGEPSGLGDSSLLGSPGLTLHLLRGKEKKVFFLIFFLWTLEHLGSQPGHI